MRFALVAATVLFAGSAAADSPVPTLDAQQLYLFKAAYPGAEIIFDCPGNFSGASDREHVLGIARPGQAPSRVGLTLDTGKWIFHDIEAELKSDKLPARHHAYAWEAPPGGAAPKCNVQPARDADLSDHGKPLGEKPLFILRPGQANACFASSGEYNNWDCIAFRKSQFRLWYQQVFAD